MRQLLIILCALSFGMVGACESMDKGSMSSKDSMKMAKKDAMKAPAKKKKKKKKKKPASGSPFTVYFKSNSVDLTDSSEGSLFDIMQKVRPYKIKKVTLYVHSDLAGTPAQNMTISEKRGAKLAESLKGAGVKEVVVVAVGDKEPIVETRSANQTNRRGIIVFHKPKKKKK